MKSSSVWSMAVAIHLAAGVGATAEPKDAPGIRVPDGFEVALFADADLANDIYCLTIDAQGRVVVAGRGYVRLLLDHDGDGRADGARTFSDLPASGAQGMYLDGNDLICTGDGAVLRFHDADADGRADGPPERLLSVKTGGEHDTHAIRKGPDGWWYVLAGNNAGVDSRFASLASSPIRDPSAGALYRLTPDFENSEVLADGFRNAYDFDFNAQGDLFVYDSDGERDISLPWYQPTRVFLSVPGSNAGWVSRSWKRPDYFLEMPPVVGRFGRGSPTGVECYRHEQFPVEYRGAVFIADWTFGRVLAMPLVVDGSTYRSEPIEFMTGVGTFGFAPTDLAVAPDGSLFVSVGGRGTRGSVYRVRYVGDRGTSDGAVPADGVSQCLRAPQPLASWSRATWEPLATKVGREAIAHAALDEGRSAAERMRAIEILVEHFGGLTADELLQLARVRVPQVQARAAWALRQAPALETDRGADVVAAFLRRADPLSARFALEALLGKDSVSGVPQIWKLVGEMLDSDDRFVRQTAARVAAELPAEALAGLLSATGQRSVRSHLAALYAASLAGQIDRAGAIRFAATAVADDSLDERTRVGAARLAQLARGDVGGGAGLSDVFDGYSGPLSSQELSGEVLHAIGDLAASYPTGNVEVDHEVARALAIAGAADQGLLDRVLAPIMRASHPVQDIHQLIVAARLSVPRTEAQRDAIAAALVQLDDKIRRDGLNLDLHWEPRMGELYARLARLDEALPKTIAAHPDFGGPGSLLFLSEMRGRVREAALAKIVRHVRAQDGYPWSSDLVFALVDAGRPEYLDLVRARAEDYRVQSAVSIALAGRADTADRPLFVAGLDSPTHEVLESCLAALARLPASDDPSEQAALIKLVRRLGTESRDVPLRDRAVRLLRRNTGKQFGYTFGRAGPQADIIARWTAWLAENHAEVAAEHLGTRSADAASLTRLLEKIDWEAGDAGRGEKLFLSRSCAQCHTGRGAVGPDLAGVTKRFSRSDILTAIADPSRDVSSRYATRSVETTSGKTQTGLVIYESVDGLTLRNALNQTIRIEADEIDSMRTVNVSLMPAGLLDDITPEEMADLFAYLATL